MRFLVLAGVLLLGLLTASSALAAGAEREIDRNLAFELEVDSGFDAQVYISNNDGDINALIMIKRGPQVAYYFAPATVTADRVTARFGRFGELDYRFAPKPKGSVECTGSERGEAVFDGTFAFTGENGYVEIEADHAEGSFQTYPEPKTCQPSRLVRRVVPYTPTYSDEGATLRARSLSRPPIRAREVTVADAGGRRPHRITIYATLAERRQGVTSARGVLIAVRSSAFRWNLARGTATLRPPAPFTGSATFVRRGDDGQGTWRGSLGMPILGGDPVKLAGGGFRAFIHKGVQQDR